MLNGGMRADQSISTKAMGNKLRQVVDIVRADPAAQIISCRRNATSPGPEQCRRKSSSAS